MSGLLRTIRQTKEETMCVLIAEIIMLLGDLYAMFTGKITLTRKLRLQGRRARAAGLILALPLPLALLIGFLLGFLVNAGVVPQSVVNVAGIIDLVLVLLALAAVMIFGYATRPNPEAAEPLPSVPGGDAPPY
jgi:hypothetical protein